MSGLVRNDRYSDKVIYPVVRQRRSLFLKYFVTLFVAVVVPLIIGAAGEAWFGYRDQRLNLN